MIYNTEMEKFAAVIKEIKQFHEAKRPVLFGTISFEKSELLIYYLTRTGVNTHFFNAKTH